jgi:hypothetical protein
MATFARLNTSRHLLHVAAIDQSAGIVPGIERIR